MNKKISSMVAMFSLAAYPVLAYYMSPLSGFSWGDLMMWAGFFFVFICSGKLIKSYDFPSYFFVFWIYVSVITIITASPFRVSLLIPGGFAFFAWSVFLGQMSEERDISSLKKSMRVVFFIAAVLFAAQEIAVFLTGSRFSALLPISDYVYGGLTIDELRAFQSRTSRSASFFMEPAYFAEYCLALLCIELFDEEGKKVLFNKYSIIIFVLLLFLRSGCGLVGMSVLAVIKLIGYSGQNTKKIPIIILLIIPMIFAIYKYYLSSEIGASMLERVSEFQDDSDRSSGFTRTIRGFIVYSELPTVNKIVGISNEALLDSPIAKQLSLEKNTLIANGIQTVLIRYGLIGLVLFLLVLLKMCNIKNPLSLPAIVLFIAISLLESTFLSPTMLLLWVLAFIPKKREVLKMASERINN